MNLTIGYFYKEELNLYGDNGNIEILTYRAKNRGINVDVIQIDTTTKMTKDTMRSINLVFMGGGPDSGQKNMYVDLIHDKGIYLKDYIENNGVGLFICGSYQLLGHYYKAADGSILDGLGIYDLYTQHFGNKKERCIGNVTCDASATLDIAIPLVGFENHGGRTYLGEHMVPLARVTKGFGNNGEDKTEGVVYKKSIGTYLHGPILSKNPLLADYLIASALKIPVEDLPPLAHSFDGLITTAHTASTKLKQ